MSLTITLPPDVERRIAEEAARDGLDPSSLALKILLTAGNESGMSDREAELIAQIHRLSAPRSLGERRRYQKLREKNREGQITPAEQEQLFAQIEANELRAAERLRYLGELAQLRGQGLLDTIKSLGLQVPGVV